MRKLIPPLLASVMLCFASAAHSAVTNHTATLSGANEAPPNSSPGTGTVTLLINDTFNEMRLHVDFSGLAYPSTAAHIHCCTPEPGTAMVATQVPSFVGFPLNVTSGTYDMTFDLLAESTYNPAFITDVGGTVQLAATELINGIRAGEAYLNIHSTVYPAGEIRGFLVAAPIPEPGSMAMWAVGLMALAGAGRWRGRTQYKKAA
jgi:hypothetical protein